MGGFVLVFGFIFGVLPAILAIGYVLYMFGSVAIQGFKEGKNSR